MLGYSIEETSERTRKNSIQENLTLTWKTTERVEVAINPTRRVTEIETSEEREITTGSHQGKSLVLLQVNCRSILNKNLEFWNLVDTYSPDVIIGTESWLREEINNAEVFRE
jgi:nucleoside phosphorylase